MAKRQASAIAREVAAIPALLAAGACGETIQVRPGEHCVAVRVAARGGAAVGVLRVARWGAAQNSSEWMVAIAAAGLEDAPLLVDFGPLGGGEPEMAVAAVAAALGVGRHADDVRDALAARRSERESRAARAAGRHAAARRERADSARDAVLADPSMDSAAIAELALGADPGAGRERSDAVRAIASAVAATLEPQAFDWGSLGRSDVADMLLLACGATVRTRWLERAKSGAYASPDEARAGLHDELAPYPDVVRRTQGELYIGLTDLWFGPETQGAQALVQAAARERWPAGRTRHASEIAEGGTAAVVDLAAALGVGTRAELAALTCARRDVPLTAAAVWMAISRVQAGLGADRGGGRGGAGRLGGDTASVNPRVVPDAALEPYRCAADVAKELRGGGGPDVRITPRTDLLEED